MGVDGVVVGRREGGGEEVPAPEPTASKSLVDEGDNEETLSPDAVNTNIASAFRLKPRKERQRYQSNSFMMRDQSTFIQLVQNKPTPKD